jgi:hypothetical protein
MRVVLRGASRLKLPPVPPPSSHGLSTTPKYRYLISGKVVCHRRPQTAFIQCRQHLNKSSAKVVREPSPGSQKKTPVQNMSVLTAYLSWLANSAGRLQRVLDQAYKY